MCRINRRGATDPTEAGLCPEVVYLRAEQPPLEHIRVFSQPRKKCGVLFCPSSTGLCIKKSMSSGILDPPGNDRPGSTTEPY